MKKTVLLSLTSILSLTNFNAMEPLSGGEGGGSGSTPLQTSSTETFASSETNIKPDQESREQWAHWDAARTLRDKKNEAFRKMMQEHPQLLKHKEDMLQKTLLHTAAEMGDRDQVKFLIENGAELNAQDIFGKTPLHQSVKRSENVESVISDLVGAGADINAKDNNGNTPLKSAVYEGSIKAVKTLLQKGADPTIKNTLGQSPLHEAAYFGKTELLQVMLEAKPEAVNQTDPDGSTPLHLAANVGRLSSIQELLKAKANPNAQDKKGRTPLYLAVECFGGHLPSVKALLEAGADPVLKDNWDTSPMMAARSKEIIKLLQDQLLSAVTHK